MYDFMITDIPGFYTVWYGQTFMGEAFRRQARKGQRGNWTFQPVGQDTLLREFKTKLDIARYIHDDQD